MNRDHASRGGGRAAEPVQVYLAPADQDRLGRLRDTLATTKSDVLRRGLEALETQLSDPDRHPALSIIGLFRGAAAAEAPPHVDAARDHDEFLAVSFTVMRELGLDEALTLDRRFQTAGFATVPGAAGPS